MAATLRLANYDLWMTFIKNVHVISTSLNVDLFRQSLSKSMAIYWPTRGRLERDDRGWKIDCTAEIPVHFLIEKSDCLPPLNENVIQADLSDLLPESSSIFLHDRSLLHFKLTLCGDMTAIGVSWHHVLGDATTLKRFMLTLSEFYESIESSSPPPLFSKHDFGPPSQEALSKFAPMMPHVCNAAVPSSLIAKYSAERIIPVHFIVFKAKVSALKESMQATVGSCVALSMQDCLTAYIVATLNWCKSNAIRRITNAAQWRSVSAPWASQDLAGNPIYIIPTQDIDTSNITDVAHIALLIRQSVLTARDAEYVDGYMSTTGYLMSAAADAGKQFYFGSDPQVLSVNSTISLNWQNIMFGARDAKFYTSGVSRYHLRLFSANSRIGGAIDVSFGVPEVVYPKLMQRLPLENGVLNL
ncbi:hydroxycinnamoyl shikimate quinate hydroxycinnamoyltransferase [Moniliophthora roreri MCA 2997]|uniref:Hydroxycinnamoyl shikimate quinate hydroxycinnamoyltransferase n=1 Tax=Moniliophthora roreri (strain MCA 2997) TaxID=1381753 RepID=V2XSU7_MONRO|nr:hydroxycinnamoyl shikimate quinate hydroxycinnamoyltransferase [Moniliophthora roreri MCA 2997]